MSKKNQLFLLAAFGIVSLYFVTRLVNLTILPIFTDEAIYIRWAQIGLRDASHRFLSLEDGKQPLFIWLMYPMLKIFADPLVAGRIVSILAGFASLIGLTILARVLFGRKAMIPTALLYIISPYFLFYDRLAIYDSLTNVFAIWALLLQVLLVKHLELKYALLLGFAIGGGLLTKSSAQFSLYLLPFSLLLFNWTKKPRLQRLIKWIGLALIAAVIALLFSWIIRLSPLAHMVGQKNLTFIVSFSDFIKNPFGRLVGNLRGLTNWLVSWFTIPWVIGLILSIAITIKHLPRKILLLLSWFTFPYFALAAFAIVLYPRFTLFMTFPLLLILANGFIVFKEKVKNTKLLLFAYSGLLAFPIYFSGQLLINPINAPLPSADRLQFIDDWPAGYGITEVNEFLRHEAKKEPIFVATEGTFGLTPYALTIYLQGTPNLEIKGYWPISAGMEEEILEIAKTKTTYVLFKDTQEPRIDWPLELVAQYRKGKGNIFMKLYKVNTPK